MGPRAKIDIWEEEMIDVRSKISLSRLIDGGAAMFADTSKNHHKEIEGKILNIPLVRNSLREDVDS